KRLQRLRGHLHPLQSWQCELSTLEDEASLELPPGALLVETFAFHHEIRSCPTTVERFLSWAYLGYRGHALSSCVMQMERKQWTISRGFAVTIQSAATMVNAVRAT